MILCLGRTGSTHLQSMLDHHSQARCYGEIFGDGKPPTFASSGTDDPAEFVDGLLAGGPERAAGFKLPINSIRLTEGSAAIVGGDPGIAVIRLSRRNGLAQVVSRQLLAATGVSQSIFGSYGNATVTIDPLACIRALEGIAEEEAELDQLAAGHESFRIAYEELGEGPRMAELQRFLDLEPEPLRSWFEPLRRRPLSETISNWDELVEGLEGSGYEEFLVEPG